MFYSVLSNCCLDRSYVSKCLGPQQVLSERFQVGVRQCGVREDHGKFYCSFIKKRAVLSQLLPCGNMGPVLSDLLIS